MRWLFLCLGVFLTGCLSPALNTPILVNAQSNTHLLNGNASWYGPKFAGRKTANGEIFDPSQLTAAHQTLPFGSYVLVTNLSNNRSVTVRINDRGPFKAGRIIDLSRVAAEVIGMIGPGTARVKLELIDPYAQAPAAPAPVASSAPITAAANARVASDLALTGFNVISEAHPVGQLLLLEGNGAPVMVRVSSNAMPISSGVDLFVSPEALSLLGDWVSVSTN